MRGSPRFPRIFWRGMRRINRRILSNYGPGSRAAGRVLVLTTLGRMSGLPRKTPLQFEEVEGNYYVASARGTVADWYRNLEACPNVNVQVGGEYFSTVAEPMTDVKEIADFLELRLKRHPRFMGVMLRFEGLPGKYTRGDLEEFATRLAIVTLPQSSSK